MRPFWFGVLAICLVEALPNPQVRNPQKEAVAVNNLIANKEFGTTTKAEEDRQRQGERQKWLKSVRQDLNKAIDKCMMGFEGRPSERMKLMTDCAIEAKRESYEQTGVDINPSSQYMTPNFANAEAQANRARVVSGIGDVSVAAGVPLAVWTGMGWGLKKTGEFIWHAVTPFKGRDLPQLY